MVGHAGVHETKVNLLDALIASYVSVFVDVSFDYQALKQIYVLVLGLDVLGNPFGVIRGLATGIEDLFYEPCEVSTRPEVRCTRCGWARG